MLTSAFVDGNIAHQLSISFLLWSLRMSADRSAEFRTKEWLTALRAYGEGLYTSLSANLCKLSGTGLDLRPTERITLMVQETDPAVERQKSWQGDGRDENRIEHDQQGHVIKPPVQDLAMLGKWLSSDTERLLLLAPFGAGKSVLLATFTCRLAENVVRWCDQQGEGIMPPVPLPVRLRAWKWHGEEKFGSYVRGRSQDVLYLSESTMLSADQMKLLVLANKLLPLYDGFDELPNLRDVRNAAFEEMCQLTSRFILSARPGHGAETKFHHYQQYSLRELPIEQTEQFIRQRLPLHTGHSEHPALESYRKAQPHIQELFRRPLFLVAWCEHFRMVPESPATTLSELMDVVLAHVFDGRAFQAFSHSEIKNADDVRERRHELGAVLAAYAEQGFGTPCYPMELARSLNASLLDKSVKEVWQHIMEELKESFYELSRENAKELITMLLSYMQRPDYKVVWPIASSAIDVGLGWMEPADAKSVVTALIPYSFNKEYEEAWLAIRNAIGTGLYWMESAEVKAIVSEALMSRFLSKDYKNVWGAICHVIGAGLRRMESADVKSVVTALIPYSFNKEPPRPPKCAACTTPFKPGHDPIDFPEDPNAVISCHNGSCDAVFLREPLEENWTDDFRRKDKCPKCGTPRLSEDNRRRK